MPKEVLKVTAVGTVDGCKVEFELQPNQQGLYRLSRVIGRVPGTKSNDAANTIYSDSKERVIALLHQKSGERHVYNIHMVHFDQAGLSRRHEFSYRSLIFHYR